MGDGRVFEEKAAEFEEFIAAVRKEADEIAAIGTPEARERARAIRWRATRHETGLSRSANTWQSIPTTEPPNWAMMCPGGELADEGLGFGLALRRVRIQVKNVLKLTALAARSMVNCPVAPLWVRGLTQGDVLGAHGPKGELMARNGVSGANREHIGRD
jgi:hypothetical protein